METEHLQALLRRTAAYGLDVDRAPVEGPTDDDDWRLVVESAVGHRLSGLLAASVKTADLLIADAHRAALDDLHVRISAKVLLLEATLNRVARSLAEHQIPVRVLKGPAHAQLLYPDPLWRPYVDIDLLVPGERFDESSAVLVGLGYRRRSQEIRPGFDRRFGKGATFESVGDGNVDLHRTLIAGPYAFLVDHDTLWERATEFTLNGETLPALGPEERLIHACVTAMLSDQEPKLISVRDVVQAVHDPGLDVDRLQSLCDRWRIGGVVESAVRAATGTLSTTADLVTDLGPDRTMISDRLACWAYRGDRARWRRQALSAIPFVPGWSNRVRYARAVLAARAPDAD